LTWSASAGDSASFAGIGKPGEAAAEAEEDVAADVLLADALLVVAADVVAAPPAADDVALLDVLVAAALVVAALVAAALVVAALDDVLVWAAVVAVGLLLPQAVMSAPTPPMPIKPETRRNVRRVSLRLAVMSCGSMMLLSPPMCDIITALAESGC
jgi:hypothetical protein